MFPNCPQNGDKKLRPGMRHRGRPTSMIFRMKNYPLLQFEAEKTDIPSIRKDQPPDNFGRRAVS